MSSEIESSTLSAPEPARSNSFQRLFGVLFSPVQTMKSIVAKPDWLIPMIFLIVAMVAVRKWFAVQIGKQRAALSRA